MENFNLNAFLDSLGLDPMIFIAAGALLALLGLIKIVGKGISLLIWALLLVIGISAFNYGMERQDPHFSSSLSSKILQTIQPGKEISQDALRALCATLPKAGVEQTGTRSNSSRQGNQPAYNQQQAQPYYDPRQQQGGSASPINFE